jgi:hypothetical protein
LPSIAFGHEVAETCVLLVCHAGEHNRAPSLGIGTVHFRFFDLGVGNNGRFATPFGANEQIIFPSHGNGAHRSLGASVLEFQGAMTEIRA